MFSQIEMPSLCQCLADEVNNSLSPNHSTKLCNEDTGARTINPTAAAELKLSITIIASLGSALSIQGGICFVAEWLQKRDRRTRCIAMFF